jgi:hypothetical protein
MYYRNNNMKNQLIEGYAPVSGFRTKYDRDLQVRYCSNVNCIETVTTPTFHRSAYANMDKSAPANCPTPN